MKNELDNSQQAEHEVPNGDKIARSRLGLSIVTLAQSMYEADQIQLGTGLADAADAIAANVPTVDDILDGKLTLSLESRKSSTKRTQHTQRETALSDRRNRIPVETEEGIRASIDSLPINTAVETQTSLDRLLLVMRSIHTVSTARRLQSHLPIVIPQTNAGFIALKHIADAHHKAIPTEIDDLPHVKEVVETLTGLDRQLVTNAEENDDIMAILTTQAQVVAAKRLVVLKEENSPELQRLRRTIAQRKIADLRHLKPAHSDGNPARSVFELLVNEIIHANELTAVSQDAGERSRTTLDNARESVLNSLARKRATEKVMLSIEEDPLLCEALARRHNMTAEDLLRADWGTKKLTINNALNGRRIVLSVEERRVFHGETILHEEKMRLTKQLADPLICISQLSDDELVVIRHGIPKVSEAKSVFDRAKEQLGKQLEASVVDDDLLETLTKQIARELLLKRCPMAIDAAMYDLGINSTSLLKNPALPSQQAGAIVTRAINYVHRDTPPLRLPPMIVEGVVNADDSAHALGMDQPGFITEKNIIHLLKKLSDTPDTYGVKSEQREGVNTYMIDQKGRELLSRMGRLMADLSRISNTVILPETEDETSCFLTMIVDAIATGKPLTLVTPICPNWSRDEEGRYDFKSLGGDESFIAEKFFAHGREMLAVLAKHQIPFRGILLFADWGLETEINAKDTYGQKLSAQDVQMCFQSTVATTDEHLKVLQEDAEVGHLFADYSIVSMKDWLEKRLNVSQTQTHLEAFFTSDRRGRRLLNMLASQSYKINRARLGLSEEENRTFALRNLIEYATVGQSIPSHSMLVVCESKTTSKSYNLPRQKHENVPVFFVKGKEGIDEGVNIL